MAYAIPFIRELDIEYGEVDRLTPLIRRVVCPNPGAFTFKGTGTYIIGEGNVAVIDAGPADPKHVDAILRATEGETITHQLVTHTHVDHSPGARLLKEKTGAKTWAYGPHGSGKDGPKVEEGGDFDFDPDHQVRDGDVIEGDGWSVECVHTPGHTSNHICFALREEKALFTGDHIMGWSTTIVSPPDGDMTDYFNSLDKLLARDDAIYYPTHGAPIRDVHNYVQAYKSHRQLRENQILDVLKSGPKTIPEMVAVMYADVDKSLHRAAARSVYAHLVHMTGDGRVKTDGAPTEKSVYSV
ncbi:MAG: MBL fold metallo-hydrolase [Minwuia sp.]|uniref:MBL fold metallo-hydrolase n=1 Tax=Minwuia sp. TaxID=2493630 RepID=UPI003A83AA9E